METGLLTAFIAVAECSSFSKASEQLHLTQSAISKRIAALEAHLDIILFERFGQRIQLTEAGKTLLIDARDILAKVEQMQRHSDMSKQVISGKLRIATSHHIGLYRLPSILQHFVSKNPNVQLDIHFTDSEIAYEEVLQGHYDLAIVTLPNNPSKSIQTIPLWKDELVIMLSKNHAISSHKKINTDTLAEHPAILPDKDTFTRRIIDQFFEQAGVSYQLAFATNYLETIKVMIEAGLGWSVLPSIMLNEKLISKPLPMLQPMRQLGLLLHKKKTVTPALEAFLATIKQHKDD